MPKRFRVLRAVIYSRALQSAFTHVLHEDGESICPKCGSDPAENMIGILLTQRMMDSPQPPPVFNDFWTLAYWAME